MSLQVADQGCPVCNHCFAKEDVIPLNGTPDQQAQLRAQLPFRKAAKPAKGTKRKAPDKPGVPMPAAHDKAKQPPEVSRGS